MCKETKKKSDKQDIIKGKMIKISSLKLNKSNPRQIRKDQLENLKKSIESFERMLEIRPIIIDEKRTVLGGKMRVQALKELGYKEIPEKWVKKVIGLTEDQKAEFIIKDNISYGDWNWDILNTDWDHNLLNDWGFDEFKDNNSSIFKKDKSAEDVMFKGKKFYKIVDGLELLKISDKLYFAYTGVKVRTVKITAAYQIKWGNEFIKNSEVDLGE